MQLQKKLKALQHLDHVGHQVALGLVGASAAAELLRRALPQIGEFSSMLSELLHVVHLVALGVAILYVSTRVFLKRNVGREMAKLLDYDDPVAGDESSSTQDSATAGNRKYGYERISISEDDVVFVNAIADAPANTLFEMNEAYFAATNFEIDGRAVRKRNSEWIVTNPKVFMLVRLPIGVPRKEGEGLTSRYFFGYTSIVPLNDIGTDVYLRGLIKDKDLPASLIAKPGEPSETFLIFAVAMAERYRKDRSLAAPYLKLLLRAAEYHVTAMAAVHGGHSNGMKVWTQSEYPSIVDHLRKRGFRGTEPPTMSAEGFELLYL